MKARWLLIVCLTACASYAHGQGFGRSGRFNQSTGAPVPSQPTKTASPARTASPPRPSADTTRGVATDISSNLVDGVTAELMQEDHDAIRLLTKAIREEQKDPVKLALAYRFRGLAYKHLGRRDAALADFLEVIPLQPKLDLGYYDAGVIYNLTGRYKAAVEMMTRAIKLGQDHRGLARQRSERGNAYFHLGQFKRAQDDLLEAVRIDPRDPDVLNNAAWFRATCPDAAFRNGTEAVELASKACALEKWQDADQIDTLAAAQAEA